MYYVITDETRWIIQNSLHKYVPIENEVLITKFPKKECMTYKEIEMDQKEKDKILDEYCLNNMQKLRDLCFPLFATIGGIAPMDYDDLYSIGLSVLHTSINDYDETQNCKFSTYLIGNIKKKYKTYIRDRNRAKRSFTTADKSGNKKFHQNVSLDEIQENGKCLGEQLQSGLNVEDMLDNFLCKENMSEKIEEYFLRLSNTQQKIAVLLASNYSNDDIMRRLELTKREFGNHMLSIQAYENVRILM